jgi:hypothetical protein
MLNATTAIMNGPKALRVFKKSKAVNIPVLSAARIISTVFKTVKENSADGIAEDSTAKTNNDSKTKAKTAFVFIFFFCDSWQNQSVSAHR